VANEFLPQNWDAILSSQIQQESGWRSGRTSPKGAVGIAQVLPSTGAEYGFTKEMLETPQGGLHAQRVIMSDLLAHYNGDVEKALAAYYTGKGNVPQNGPIPGYAKGYVSSIMGRVRGGASKLASAIGPTPAYAGEDEEAQLQALPQFQKAPPEKQQQILSDFRTRSPDLQKQILDSARQMNLPAPSGPITKVPTINLPANEPESPDLSTRAANMAAINPLAEPYARATKWYQQNIAGPVGAYAVPLAHTLGQLRSAGAGEFPETVDPLTPASPTVQGLTRAVTTGDTPMQGFFNVAMLASGVAERTILKGLQEGKTLAEAAEEVPTWARAAVPLVSSRLRRVLTPAIIGGAQGYATSPRHPYLGATAGAVLGGAAGLAGEIERGAVTTEKRIAGELPHRQQITEGVAGEMGLAAGSDLERMAARGDIVPAAVRVTQPARDALYDLTKDANGVPQRLFIVPKITPRGTITNDYEQVTLQEAEDVMRKLQDLGTAPKRGMPGWTLKASKEARFARSLNDEVRENAIYQLDELDPTGRASQLWDQQRRVMADAFTTRRLFSDYSILDRQAGKPLLVNQNELVEALTKEKDMLVRGWGQAKYDRVWAKATSNAKGAVEDIVGEPLRVSISGHAGIIPIRVHAHGGVVPRSAGPLPFWQDPPRAPFTWLTAQGIRKLAQNFGLLPRTPDVVAPPPPPPPVSNAPVPWSLPDLPPSMVVPGR